MPFGMEKLKWCVYPIVKKKLKIIRFDTIHERDRRTDRQTDGHRMTAKAALAQHSIARQINNGKVLRVFDLPCVVWV